uniref:Hyaluronidase n=1 Tax=Setaria digitata TaxID=48799 RepID=A0A915PHQ8_9BILA
MIRSLLKILTNAWLTIIWNVPSEQCESHYTIPVQEYGILVNDRQKFYGNNIVTLYEEKFGLYPYYRNFSDPKSAINGGIPQRASIKAHLSKVRLDIAKAMPNRSFDGLAIVDYEKWRPLWEHNWYTKRIYQRESVAYVKQRYKSISDRSAELIAINEFNRAAM